MRDLDLQLFATLPVVLAGDNWQLGPVKGMPWYKTLCQAAVANAPERHGSTCPKARGVRVLRAARRLDLVRLMRARTDPQFIAVQEGMRVRDADGLRRLPAALRALNDILRENQPRDDGASGWEPEWQFAPVGVLGNAERDLLNARQMEAFAKHFDVPLIKWRIPVAFIVKGGADERRVYDELYEHEPGLWGYYVEGAPAYMTETICAPRKLVNGSPVLLRSLVFDAGVVPENVRRAYAANKFEVVELDEPPLYVNVIVGGTAAKPRMWHGVPLEDLSACITSLETDEQVVPLSAVRNTEDKIYLTSAYAAQQGFDPTVCPKKRHTLSLAFGITDFKLQGRTLPRLVLSPGKGRKGPPMRLSKLYVLISRVQTAKGLRMLPGSAGFKHDWKALLERFVHLVPDPDLIMWEGGYDDDGNWEAARAVQARAAFTTEYERTKKAAKKATGKASKAGTATTATAATAATAATTAPPKPPPKGRGKAATASGTSSAAAGRAVEESGKRKRTGGNKP